SALVAIKSALGLTYTKWSTTTTPSCYDPSTTTSADWDRISCSTSGDVIAMDLSGQSIVRKDLPSQLTVLSALTSLAMDRNLLDGSMGSYLKYLTGLSALQKLSMAYMYFSGQFPSFILDSTSLTSLDISTNYLTGSLPSTITKIKSLKFDSNYFVGSLPSAPWTTCGCTSNCLSSAGTCGGSNTGQRSRATCAICGSTDGTGTLCTPGQSCDPDDEARISAKTINLVQADLPLRCPFYTVILVAAQADAMMALKAALGVTLTTWASTTPCRVTGLLTPLTNEWTGVLCNPAGSVESISVPRQSLKGSLPSDISKLTALTYLDFGYNLLQGSLAAFVTQFKDMTTLKALFFNYNWFSGSIPSFIASLPQLTTL
ncbi:unnamed protein product, partial [Closterium sp. Naga37s-1]